MNPTHFRKVLVIGMTSLLLSCSQSHKDESSASYTDSVASPETVPAEKTLSSSAAVENRNDTLRKFIRTADLKIKVGNVIQATYQIEDIINRVGGFVTYTHLASTTQYQHTTRISPDSSIESTHFTVDNTMTIRVPNTRLDSTLKSIAPLVTYMDHRTIKADDIGLQILSNKLHEERTSNHEKRMKNAIDNRGKKLEETINAEDNLFYKRESADNAMISNLSLMDQVNYSTVTIYLYQNQEIKNVKVANEEEIEAYEPAFGLKLLQSLQTGWKIIETLILFLVQLWALILTAGILYVLYRKFAKKNKS